MYKCERTERVRNLERVEEKKLIAKVNRFLMDEEGYQFLNSRNIFMCTILTFYGCKRVYIYIYMCEEWWMERSGVKVTGWE